MCPVFRQKQFNKVQPTPHESESKDSEFTRNAHNKRHKDSSPRFDETQGRIRDLSAPPSSEQFHQRKSARPSTKPTAGTVALPRPPFGSIAPFKLGDSQWERTSSRSTASTRTNFQALACTRTRHLTHAWPSNESWHRENVKGPTAQITPLGRWSADMFLGDSHVWDGSCPHRRMHEAADRITSPARTC